VGGAVTFARWVFLIAGVYGLIVLVPQFFMEGRIGREFPPAITHPEHFYGFLGVGAAWQVLFLIVAADPVRYRLVMIPSVLEKLSFGAAAIVLFLQGRLALAILAAACIDLVLGVLFGIAFVRTPGVSRIVQPEPSGRA
jgi:hypothetical protein